MSFENIQLPPFLIQDLYKDLLVDDRDTPVIPPVLEKITIPHLGKNNKKILVLINETGCPFLPDDELSFLLRILEGCKLSMADIALVNFQNLKEDDVKKLSSEFNPEKNILFDVTPSQLQLPMHFPHFQVQQFNNRSYLSSPSLKMLAADTELKKQLWDRLKKLFDL